MFTQPGSTSSISQEGFDPETLSYGVQQETLDILAAAKQYNQWIFDSFQHQLGERVLEIGCGIGTYTEMLFQHATHVTALDTVPAFIETLKSRVQPPAGKTLDARCQNILESTEGLGSYDAIVMLNVLEHIQHDALAVDTLKGLLRPGGRLILLVPALSGLYSDYDRAVHHFRRYEKRDLQALLLDAGMRVETLYYFNALGILGWWLQFCLLKRTTMQTRSVAVFDAVVPWVRLAESIFRPPVGLSLIAIARV